MNKSKQIWVMVGLLFMTLRLEAQDFQYSQFFAAPLYLNPAFTGSSEMIRVGFNNRIQWPGLNKSFKATSVYADFYSHSLQSGFGISANSFLEEHIQLRTQDISGFYSYRLKVGERKSLRFGTQVSYQVKSADMGDLIHQDQIDPLTRTVSGTTSDFIPDFENQQNFSISFGMLYTDNNFWIGISNHHINNPQLWFIGDDQYSHSFQKYSIHGGYQFLLSDNSFSRNTSEKFFLIKGNYKQQGPFKQLDLATQLTLGILDLGLGYRGIPGTVNLPNRDSIISMLGFNIDSKYLVGYSYDWQLSGLGNDSRGVHEISIRLKFHTAESRLNAMQNPALRCFYYLF
ncbi:MAG: type IX secretion system membrane protein PorP/SprF [Mongoliibacter sp.]|uniref:PorP/SprF family type IX secretion system membrane protein n=1 Tax=Mongoliibacter sp. TaxID=2022438 RepID=UPI0012F12917|nr:PorP/SprF family type IX secretion system membrane protein [Mongoliibacter sp.]TVP47805.1 MAG: type IX secretion system membrane protein PorP/SprF [Mongoliibacter sp.]